VSAYDDVSAFKLYCLDVGVLRRLARMDAATFAKTDALFREFKGAFAENYVLQALLPQLDGTPRYWTNDKPKHEVDFVVQIGNRIVPVEVKSGQNVTSASLRYYANKYPDETPLRVRFSLRNLSFDGSVLNVPLYLADQAVQLVRLAQGSQPSR
jgi:predicted AAA+ superfamily ATPase